MSLETGVYIIKSDYSSGAMGRNFAGDGEQVFSLPPQTDTPRWQITKLHDGYNIRIEGTATAEINGHIHALTHDESHAESWDVKLHEQHGPNMYTIEKLNGSLGWVMEGGGAFASIAVQPIMATQSHPPRYLKPFLFEITKAGED